MKQAVQVTVLGQTFTIRSEAPPQEVVRVADLVNRQVEEVRGGGRTVDTLNLAILALMNLGGAYLRLQEERQETERVAERLRQILHRLENAGAEGSPASQDRQGLFPG